MASSPHAAKAGHNVAISVPTDAHAASLRNFADEHGVLARTTVLVSPPDAVDLPDCSWDTVASLHVLEHVDDPGAVLREVRRLMAHRGLIALPTCLNPAAICRLGGGDPYRFSLGSVFWAGKGTVKLARALVRRDRGLWELQSQDGRNWQHDWVFPWTMRSELKRQGFEVTYFAADAICLPWFDSLIPLMRLLDRSGAKVPLKWMGMGSHAIIEAAKD